MTRRSLPVRARGFTLIEVMVGVAIFAVLSALVVGSLQSNADRNAKLEAQRFIAVVNEVRDEAVISGKTIVMQMDDKSRNYGFSVLGGADSSLAGADKLFRTRNLHKSVKLSWDVFDEFNDDDDDVESVEEGDAPTEVKPRVYVSALGSITPFQARFGGEDDDFIVALNDDGVLFMDIKPSNFF